ncbi:MAG TPA: lipid-A-disaccharide synthase N-terminal domain-containing protein [Planctomycetota bacterium]|nr:lipid-A-disaccharide synthase N-terminal domain-containing protein [Planctomycetota bacterium]
MQEFWAAFRNPLVLLGFLGQSALLGRFAIQWIASEREGRSVIPVIFWHLSIVAAILLAIYAWFRKDPVFLIGQGAALAIYVRNLFLTYRKPGPAKP